MFRSSYKCAFAFFLLSIVSYFFTSCCYPALADNSEAFVSESQRTTIADSNISVEIPSGWHYADRNCSETNAIAIQMGHSKDELINILDKNGWLFVAVSPNFYDMISLSVSDIEFDDFTSLSDPLLSTYAMQISEGMVTEDEKLQKTRIIGDQIKFIKAVYKGSNGTGRIEYINVSDKKYYHFSALTDVTYSEEFEKTADEFVTSISFSASLPVEEIEIKELNLHFSVPSDFIILSEEERLKIDPSGKYVFYAKSPDDSFQMHVDLIDNNAGMPDLNDFSQEEIDQMLSSFEKLSESTFGQNGNSVHSVETIGNMKYFRLTNTIIMGSSFFFDIEYNTYYNNRSFSICFYPKVTGLGVTSEQFSGYIKQIMNSVWYDEIPESERKENELYHYFTNYSIQEEKLSIKLPDRFLTFWKNMPPNAYSLYATGEKAEKWDSYFEENPGIILYGEDPESNSSITLRVTSNSYGFDLMDYTNDQIKLGIAGWWYPDGAEHGAKDQQYMILDTVQNKYLIQKFTDTDSNHKLIASTYAGEKYIGLLLSSHTPISESIEEELIKVVLSLSVDGKDNAKIGSTDWFAVEDIPDTQIDTVGLKLLLPAEFRYVSSEGAMSELSFILLGADIDALNQTVNTGDVSFTAANYSKSVIITIQTDSSDTLEEYINLPPSVIQNDSTFMADYFTQQGINISSSKITYFGSVMGLEFTDEANGREANRINVIPHNKTLYVIYFSSPIDGGSFSPEDIREIEYIQDNISFAN